MMGLFRPAKAATVNIAVAASSGRVLVTNNTGRLQVRVMNNGSATVWVSFGDSTVTASATADVPVGPGQACGFTVDAPDSGLVYAAAIAAGATGNVYFTPGAGIL